MRSGRWCQVKELNRSTLSRLGNYGVNFFKKR